MRVVSPAVVLLGLGLAGCGPLYYDAHYDEPAYGMTAPGYEVPVVEQSEVEVTVELFYEELAPYGDFVDDPALGRVWVPHDPSYVPYTNGHWQYTEHGFTWVSKDPFGWAVCHYGRWVYADRWIWVPGTVWGPAWVVWREGGAVAGWAPMPPLGYPEPSRDSFVFVDVTYLFVEELHAHYYSGWSAHDAYASTTWIDERAYLPGGIEYCPGPRADRLRRRGVQVHVWPYRPDRRPPIAVSRPGARGRMPVEVRRPGERAAVEVRRPGAAARAPVEVRRPGDARAPVHVRRPDPPAPIEVRRPARAAVEARSVGLEARAAGGSWGYVRATEPARASVGGPAAHARVPQVVTIGPRPPQHDSVARIEPEAIPVDDHAAREAIRAAELRHRVQNAAAPPPPGIEARHRAARQAQHDAALEAQQRAALQAQHRAAQQAQHRAALEAQHRAALEAQHRAALEAQQRVAIETQQRAAIQAQHHAAIQAQHRAAIQAQQAQHRAAIHAQQAQHRAAIHAQQQAHPRAAIQAQRAQPQAAEQHRAPPRVQAPRSVRVIRR